jgi:predicted dehydrogenase
MASQLRVGMIGTGFGSLVQIPAFRAHGRAEVVAVASGTPGKAKKTADTLGVPHAFDDWRKLVAADLDLVSITTPPSLHHPMALAALAAGKHVLCEKPMAMTTAECDRMIAACRAHHVRLGIAYYRHFYPVILRVKAMLESGDIGQPVFAQVNAFEYFDPAPDHPRRWLLDPARAGGGPMMDFGCHRLEVLMHLFGAVRRTAAVTANVVFDRAVEDTAAVLLQFEGGPCAAVTVTHAAEERQDTLQVFGTRGSLHVDELNAGSLRIRTGNQSRVESHPPAANIHRPLIDDFVEALLTDREPAVTGEIGRAVAAIEDEIYAVAPSGR